MIKKKRDNHPPFDIAFRRDDPDGEIVFVFTDETRRRIDMLFPEIEWTRKYDWWVCSLYRDYAGNMAQVAYEAGLRVASGEYQHEVLVFTPWQLMTQH
jgi:hypothetical protein